jgi:glycosyltransferase involved in cell wall biosynthesis
MFILDSIHAWQSGIWLHRQEMPSTALSIRGHAVKQVAIGAEFSKELLEWPDTVIFGRAYPTGFDPVGIMKQFKKLGKRVVYDIDDDFWEVAKHNPSANVSNAHKDQYEGMIKEADAILTPSKVLEKKIKKHFKKPVFICPNGIDYEMYKERPHGGMGLTIGYMGAASHWKDLQIVVEALEDLSQKYDFYFAIYGITGDPLEAAIYTYNKILNANTQPEKNDYFRAALDFYKKLNHMKMLHIPFMPPELHPSVLSRADFDIGIAPLEDNVFNAGKSCIKYYEYASVGTVVLSSDVLPYSDEVTYRAKNTKKDWYNKLEKLIVDKEFRAKELEKQQKWVKENRSVEAIGLPWELACQQPGGIATLTQR